ncbi:MAG: hypothetical protein A2005_12500 [Desulfuromonadales bacterium GWC2_61_20]|nr:MAG: hypothetical protein A2005_12500 [Desulfuromonadales bacterium GWC2_61_20]
MLLRQSSEPSNHDTLTARYLSGFLIDRRAPVQIFERDGDRFSLKTARITPKTPEAAIAEGDGFLCFLVQVLAEIGAAAHVPRYPVAAILMEAQSGSVPG